MLWRVNIRKKYERDHVCAEIGACLVPYAPCMRGKTRRASHSRELPLVDIAPGVPAPCKGGGEIGKKMY